MFNSITFFFHCYAVFFSNSCYFQCNTKEYYSDIKEKNEYSWASSVTLLKLWVDILKVDTQYFKNQSC